MVRPDRKLVQMVRAALIEVLLEALGHNKRKRGKPAEFGAEHFAALGPRNRSEVWAPTQALEDAAEEDRHGGPIPW